jgi:hypothetical protein
MGFENVDLFDVYRWLLALLVTVYTLVVVSRALYQWLGFFASSRHTQVAGRYALLLLLRIHVRRFRGELLSIAGLLALFVFIMYLHQFAPA